MEIQTPRLLLREFKRSDWKAVHEYACDPEVVRFMEWGPNTPEETVEFVDRSLSNQRVKPRRIYDMAVIVKGEDKLIGAAGLRIVSFENEQADIGYCFNRNYWGQGLATEAARALVQFGFTKLKLHRIFATCDADNSASLAVMKHCGMSQEGHFRQDKKMKGHWRDTLLCAILRDDWEKTDARS